MTIEKNLIPGGRLDRGSFEELFRSYFTPLMLFARKILVDEDDAREVVQKVFIALWEKREDIDLTTSMKAYLYTSTRNRCFNFLQKRRLSTVEMEAAPDPANPGPGVQEKM